MAQARTLRKSELKQLIDVTTGCSRYPQRDVTMLLFSHLCGLRVGEIASLRFDDVLDDKSNVLDEVTLDASRTKGKRARKILPDISAYGTVQGDCVREDFWLIVTARSGDETEIRERERSCRTVRS